MNRDPQEDTLTQLAQTEARFARAQAIAKIGTWEIDLPSRDMWGSAEAFRIYGLELTPDGRLPLDVVRAAPLPAYRALLDEALSDLLEGRKPYDVEFEILRRNDGAVRHIHSFAEVVRGASGDPRLVSGTIQDDTEAIAHHQAMLTALRASEERARMAFEEAADAIFITSTEGRFSNVNAQAVELTGYDRGELLSGKMHMLFAHEQLERAPLRYDRVLRGECVTTERLLLRRDGSLVPVEMHTKQLPDGMLQSIVRDMSDRHRLEEQLQLRQRMDSVGVLAAGIAHDFNNILAGVMGYTCLLAQSPSKLDATQNECIQNILHATQRAADLTHSLRMLSHPEPVENSAFDIYEVAAEVVRVLRATTDRIIGKELRFEAGRYLVQGNASDIYHALMNLGINAVHAIEQKSVTPEDAITIDAELYDLPAGHSMGLVPGRYVRLTVGDTGVGMTEEVRKHAFEPLFSTRTRGDHRGQGLGLAMVYNIVVRQHGGAVDLETSVGCGCRFNLYLPAANALSPVVPSVMQEQQSGHEHVLVVEDDPQLARLTRTVLERLGYSVVQAVDGVEAISTFERERDRIDLVLLDRSLPGMRGEQVFERLVAMRPDVPVIVTSGDASTASSGFPGAFRILQKPYTPSVLGAAVRDALDAELERR